MCVCVCEHLRTYFGVEALGILGYSVELREAEHVLLAARPVKYPQSERRQSGKYLQHTEVTHAQPLKRLMTNISDYEHQNGFTSAHNTCFVSKSALHFP